jgi:PadR family transcriptional regulator
VVSTGPTAERQTNYLAVYTRVAPSIAFRLRRTVIDISLTVCKIHGMPRGHDRIPTLPPKEALILQLLAGQKEMYGLELVATSKRRLKRGTVYVTLGRMEHKGYVTSRLEDAPPSAGGLPRRLYEATAFGRRVLAAWNDVAARLVPEFVR